MPWIAEKLRCVLLQVNSCNTEWSNIQNHFRLWCQTIRRGNHWDHGFLVSFFAYWLISSCNLRTASGSVFHVLAGWSSRPYQRKCRHLFLNLYLLYYLFFFVRFVLKTLVRLHEELSSLIILCNGPKKNLCDIEMWSWEYLPRNLLVRMQITNQLTCQDGRTFVLVLIKIRVINSVTKLNRLNFYPNCKSEIVTSESHNRETLIPLQELP